MTNRRGNRYAKASIIAIGVPAIVALVLLTYADARRVLAERATAEATTPQLDSTRTGSALSADQASRLARALISTRIDGATIIYVDDDANTNGDGTSWATAFNDLQNGLDAARNLGGAPAEIWVAAGTYKPDRGTGDRTMSFELVDSTGIYGGFAGNETDFNQRDFRTNETVLTGDLLGNDVGTNGREENSFHVVRGDSVDTVAIDGMSVTAGNANANGNQGGGILLSISGAGDTTSRISNCRIFGNSARANGGGIYAREPILISNCDILGNSAGLEGGGGELLGDPLYGRCTQLDGCLIAGNSAGSRGGGVWSAYGIDLRDCSINDNSAGLEGGGVYCRDPGPVLVNVVCSGNRADSGAALCVPYADGFGPLPTYPVCINCTVVDNISLSGAVTGGQARGRATFINCILWGNEGGSGTDEAAAISFGGDVDIKYSCLQGWSGLLGGIGNTGADPGFVDARGGDYRLQAPSSAIDAGSNGALPVDVVTDLAGGARFVDHPLVSDTGVSTNGLPVVDMGAYEWFAPDCNGNGVVDVLDIVGGTSADCNSNDVPDECDLAREIVCWGATFIVQEAPVGQAFVAIAAGRHHSLAIRVDGSLVGWGANADGQIDVPPGGNYVSVAAGAYHSIALRSDGSLVGWGRNNYGESSVPAGEDFIAIAAGLNCSFALRVDGSLAAWGTDHFGLMEVPSGNDFVAIAAGVLHGLALCSDGSLVGWGQNIYGQLDIPSGDDFIAVAAGYDFSLALRTDGTLSAWGRNSAGQIDTPVGNGFTAISAGFQHALALRADGSLAAWGSNGDGQATVPAGSGFTEVAAGDYHSLALRVAGSPDCNGNNVPDECDVAFGTSEDCDGDAVPDECDVAAGTAADCNVDGVPDVCDIAAATSEDCNTNAVPDECDADFDADGIPDGCDDDVDGDGVLDVVDFCLFSPLGVPVNPFGGPMGDLDDDCLVTLDDYFYFEICLYISGPNGDPGFQDCRDIFDFDGDGDVDLADYAGFARAMAGS